MYKTLENIKFLIENKKSLEVVKIFVRSYLEGKQYWNWYNQKQEEYNQKYPEFDEEGNPIEYSDNPEDENYKPTFEEYLAQLQEEEQFIFDESKVEFDDELKQLLKQYAKVLFELEPKNGLFSQTISKKIDCERHNLDDIRSIIKYMEDNNMTEIQFRVYDNSFETVSLDQLKQIENEMIDYGLNLYQRKWEFEQKILELQTLDDLENLVW